MTLSLVTFGVVHDEVSCETIVLEDIVLELADLVCGDIKGSERRRKSVLVGITRKLDPARVRFPEAPEELLRLLIDGK